MIYQLWMTNRLPNLTNLYIYPTHHKSPPCKKHLQCDEPTPCDQNSYPSTLHCNSNFVKHRGKKNKM